MRPVRSPSWPLAAWIAATPTAAAAPALPAPNTPRTAPAPNTTPPPTPPPATSTPPAHVPAPLQLDWTAPPACPSAARVRARIEAALRRPTVPGGAAATRVQARVTPGGRGHVLVLETRTAGNAVDVRRLDDRRCSVLADAAAVIVATAIDEVDPNRAPPALPPPPVDAVPVPTDLSPRPGPGAPPDLSPRPGPGAPPDLSPGPGPAPAQDGSPRPAASPAPPNMSPGPGPEIAPADDLPRPPPAATPPPARRLSAGLRLAGLGDRGGTPGLAGGLTGGLGLIARSWRLDLAAVWLAARPTPAQDGLDVTARVGLLAAQLRACAVPRLGLLEFPVCLGFEAGGARGEGRGDALARPLVAWRPWLAPVVGAALSWPFTRRLALFVQADLVVPLVPPTFEITGVGEVYRGDRAAGRAGLGLEVKFP